MASNTADVRSALPECRNAADEANETASRPQTFPASTTDGHASSTASAQAHPPQLLISDVTTENARDNPQPSTTPVVQAAQQGALTHHTHATTSSPRAQWLPISLRWPYLCTVLAMTVIILLVVIALHVESTLHSGLGNDDGSNVTYFVSRFLPTVVAVSYVFSTSIILDDVKRSEPFARSASRRGAPATNTLFWVPGAWWTTLFNSLPSKRRGLGFSCTMLCASLVFIFGFLILSPFSSTFLATQDVTFFQDRAFGQLSLSSRLPIQAAASSLTYFRTIGNVLQNVTTSAWITDKYAVLPFWPTGQTAESMGAFVGLGSEIWRAETLVISTELECEPLNLADVSLVQDPEGGEYLVPFTSFRTASGCTLSMAMDNGTSIQAFASWTVPTDFASDYAIASNSSDCVGDEAMMFSTAPFFDDYSIVSPDPDVQAKGSLCSARYYHAIVTVTVSIGPGESVVLVDEQAYLRNRIPIPEDFMDVNGIQTLFLDKYTWPQRLFAPYGEIDIRGPGGLLAASYEFSAERLVREQLLLSKATRLKQRFLGEMIRDIFDSAVLSDEPKVQVSGQVLSNRRRVVVVPPVAITLEIVLSINFILLLLALISSRLSRRPLELSVDPATSIAIAHLASREPDTMRQLSDANITHPLALLLHLKDFWCRTIDNTLYLFDSGHSDPRQTAKITKTLKNKSILPLVLHLLPVICLFISMLAIAVAISILLGFSETDGLYQTAFVYQLDFKVAGMELDAINPASVLTTFLAVCIALWWGSVDTSIRKLQPFLALAKRSVKGLEGVALSYETSYMLWAAIRAIKRRHWLLALVSCGAFYAEIFTIASSALWSRQQSEKLFITKIPVSLEIRQVPLLLIGHINDNDFYSSSFAGEVLRESFANQTTSWMYGGTIQLALNGSEPSWSSNGWSFAPVDLSALPTKTIQNTGDNSSSAQESGVPLPSSTLAKLDTAGIHAWLECTPFDSLDDSSSWTTRQDLTDSTYWNTSANPTSLLTGYELGTATCSGNSPSIGLGYFCGAAGGIDISTTFYAQPPQLSCCENRTENGFELASVGYWSANRNAGVLFPELSGNDPFNLTVKWLRGIPQEGFIMANASSESRRLIWHEPPQMTALNCRPIIETANARVTVDIASHRVQNYSLTSNPVPDANAWVDLFSYHTAEYYTPNGKSAHPVNVTISHGAYFLAALMGASDIGALSATPRSGYPDTEAVQDQRFNIRKTGLNMDYMSYSMFSLVDSDPIALLDPATMERTAQQTFSTFFQHYASSSVSTTDGGWVFSRLDERLPADLTSVADQAMVDPPADPRAGEMVSVQVTQPIQVLQMSRAAAAIALAVLLWLMVSTVTLAYVSRDYKARLRWRIETIADILVMVTGSGRLLTMLREPGPREMKYSPDATAMLADFTTESGTLRWGIELAKPYLANGATGAPSTTSTAAAVPNSRSSVASSASGAGSAPTTSPEPRGPAAASTPPQAITQQPIPQLTIQTSAAAEHPQLEQSRFSPVLQHTHPPNLPPAEPPSHTTSTVGRNNEQPPGQDSPHSPISDDDNQTFPMEQNSVPLEPLERPSLRRA